MDSLRLLRPKGSNTLPLQVISHLISSRSLSPSLLHFLLLVPHPRSACLAFFDSKSFLSSFSCLYFYITHSSFSCWLRSFVRSSTGEVPGAPPRYPFSFHFIDPFVFPGRRTYHSFHPHRSPYILRCYTLVIHTVHVYLDRVAARALVAEPSVTRTLIPLLPCHSTRPYSRS